MVTVTGVEWLREPDVPVTISVTEEDAGVVVEWFELLPPQPRAITDTKSNSPSRLTQRYAFLLPLVGFCLPKANRVPNSPSPGRRAATPDMP